MKSIGNDIQPTTEAGTDRSPVIDLRHANPTATPASAQSNGNARRPNPGRETAFFEAITLPRRAATRPEPQAKPQHPARRITAKQIVKAVILVIAAIALLSLNIGLPERFIGIYFVASLLFNIDSQRTFFVALIFLVLVAVWSTIGNTVSAQDYAVYAFYFLIIGLISALRETVWPKTPTPRHA